MPIPTKFILPKMPVSTRFYRKRNDCARRKLCVKCLEGTTERSDSNRVRSARISAKRTICLEGSTPVAMLIVQVLWRSAFQAPRSRIDYPRTSSPVTIATLCSAFQAQTLHEYERLCKASAEAKLAWTMPSRSQTSVENERPNGARLVGTF